jgi:hypothetical protein
MSIDTKDSTLAEELECAHEMLQDECLGISDTITSILGTLTQGESISQEQLQRLLEQIWRAKGMLDSLKQICFAGYSGLH